MVSPPNANMVTANQPRNKARKRRDRQVAWSQGTNGILAMETELRRLSNVLNLPGLLSDSSIENIIYDIPSAKGKKIHVINLAELQKLVLQSLRTRLGRYASKIYSEEALTENQATRISRLMATYCNSIRDLEYMKERHDIDVTRDPFKLVSSQWRDLVIMEDAGLFSHTATLEKERQKVPDDLEHPTLLGDPRGTAKEMEWWKAFWIRFMFGFIGGIALVGPMLLMVLVGSRTAHLTTTSVATFLFALGMAFYNGPGASPLALVGATAAYAAVLVVFVGTSS